MNKNKDAYSWKMSNSKKSSKRVTFQLTAWKVSKHGVISGPDFPVFSPNTGKYGPEITPYLDIFYASVVYLRNVFFFQIVLEGIKVARVSPAFFPKCWTNVRQGKRNFGSVAKRAF